MATGTLNSPDTPGHINSPLAYVHPKIPERGSYVQRWKSLRERNRNLPKLNFNTKLAASLQRQNTNTDLGLARSLTLESIKLPTISNGSIANGSVYTTKSNKETGTRKVQEIENILSDNKSLTAALSKSMPNVAEAGTQESEGIRLSNNSPRHRYERIAQQKRLITRERKKVELKVETKNVQQLEASGIYQIAIDNELLETGDIAYRFSNNVIGTIFEHEISSGRNSGQTKFRLENDRIGRLGRRKKWRENCKCMRCEIMHRQYEERDDHYIKWGIYPCQQHLARQKFYKQYFYDSD